MDASSVGIILVIGLIAGWLASFVVGGGGLIAYLVSGVIGAFVGPILLAILGVNFSIGNPFVTQTLVAAIGAIVVVLIARVIV